MRECELGSHSSNKLLDGVHGGGQCVWVTLTRRGDPEDEIQLVFVAWVQVTQAGFQLLGLPSLPSSLFTQHPTCGVIHQQYRLSRSHSRALSHRCYVISCIYASILLLLHERVPSSGCHSNKYFPDLFQFSVIRRFLLECHEHTLVFRTDV